MFHWINQFSILECFFYGCMFGLLIVSIVGVLYGIREYRWSAAYNRGFIYGSKTEDHRNSFADTAGTLYRNNRQRRAFILGARHAQGY